MKVLIKLGAALAVLMTTSTSFGQIDELASHVQRGANAVVAVDVAALKETRMAKDQGWSAKLEAAFVDRSIVLPPEADLLLIASQLRADKSFDSDSSVGLIKLSRPYSLPAIARANNGRVESLRGRDVVTNGEMLLAPISPEVLGSFTPANRQLAGQWIADLNAKGSAPMSDFLNSALKKVGKETQIVLALDLQDVISRNAAAERLEETKVLAGSPYKVDQIAMELESLKGVVTEISVGISARAKMQVTFGKPVSLSAAIAKGMIIGVLKDQGLMLDDLEKHLFNVSGNTITVEGELSPSGLRRVMSLLEPPTPSLAAVPADSSASTETSADTIAKASQTYYKAVISLLDDLRGDRAKQDPRGGMDAVWMDKYAKKIDRLPVLNVDDELIEWAGKTAQTLRIMASARRGAGLSAGAQKAGLRTGGYTDSFYNVGYNSATSTAADANQIDLQEGNAATMTRVDGWRRIDDAAAEIRKKKTQQYGVEF